METRFKVCILTGLTLVSFARAAESDALAISANIQSRHMPFGTLLDPMYASSGSSQIIGYTRCGDSALWTGAYLAAEAFRYRVTKSADALNNIKGALAGLKALADVTGDNRLARCMVPANSPFAAGISSEEASNTIHTSGDWLWIDNTSRDQIVGAFFGLGAAYDLVDDTSVKTGISDLTTRLIGFIARHQWSPNDDLSSTFELRPESLQMLLDVARHVNPSLLIGTPPLLPIGAAVLVDVQSLGSYFKFNLDFMTFYNLLRFESGDDVLRAYSTVRTYTSTHQNAFFDMVDYAVGGINAARDDEVRTLLDQWLLRPRRDLPVDLSKTVQVCGGEACQPIPVPLRVPTDFLWQRDPFQLSGGGSGIIEGAGVDYILPYWMARYYGVVNSNTVHSAAAPSSAVAPQSIASLFGTNLAAATAQAGAQPLPATLGGVTLTVTDQAGTSRTAPLYYVSPAQINFVVPDGTVAGTTKFAVSGSAAVTATVAPVAPTLFSMNSNGTGVAAATAISTQVADPALQGPVAVFQCTPAGCVSVPILLGVDTPIYVTFYGTGIRNRSSLANVKVTINGISVPPLYAGPSPAYEGLDQVNVPLTLDLRGAGESKVVVTVDGQSSNIVTINVQ